MNQTFRDFEIIISDDNSRDETAKIILDFARIEPRIIYFRQEENLGFRDNFNFVLNEARGKYFVWAAQDDFWDKTFLEKLYGLLQKRKEAVLAMSNTKNVSDSQSEKYPAQNFTNKENRFESLLKFLKSGNLTYYYGLHKTENLKKIEGYQKSSRPFFKSSDYMTIFRVLLGGPMVFINEYLFNKFDTGNYLNRYEDLSKLKIDSHYLKRVMPYLFFPLFFVYDSITSLKYILISDFTVLEKLRLTRMVFYSFLTRNLDFIKSIFTGLYYFCKGIYRNVWDL